MFHRTKTQCRQQMKDMKIKEGVMVMGEELLDNKINLRNKAIKYNVLTLDLDSNKSTIKNLEKNLEDLMDSISYLIIE